MRRSLLSLSLLFFLCVQSAHAQLQVGLDIKRRFLMLYEPIVATVTVKNLAGRDVTLADSPTQSWFGFQINRGDDQIVPPFDPNYKLSPLTIPVGQSVKRRIILNDIYPVHDLGLYRIRATIYDASMEKYYQSPMVGIELSEGKTVWQQTVGVPEGVKGSGGTRKYSLLSFRQAECTYLYARVEDVDNSIVCSTISLGRMISGLDPDVQLDVQNTLHVLQVLGPKAYLYSHIGLNGELLGQNNYTSVKYRPILRRQASGEMVVYGGDLQADQPAGSAQEKVPNKLSDRPVPIPRE